MKPPRCEFASRVGQLPCLLRLASGHIDLLFHVGCHWQAGTRHLARLEFLAIRNRGHQLRDRGVSPSDPIRPRIFRDNIDAMWCPRSRSLQTPIREWRQPAITVGDGQRVLHVLDAAFASHRLRARSTRASYFGRVYFTAISRWRARMTLKAEGHFPLYLSRRSPTTGKRQIDVF